MRITALFISSLLSITALRAQVRPSPPPGNDQAAGYWFEIPRYQIRLSLAEFTGISQPAFRVYGEYGIGRLLNPMTVSAELGYNYFSHDEGVSVSGLHTGLYLGSYLRPGRGLRYGMFYRYTRINDYLKITESRPGLGEYSRYEKMRYHKIRYGGLFEFFNQFNLANGLFAEVSFGGGFIHMETVVPEHVTQYTYHNGIERNKTSNTPTLCFGVRLGYAF